MDVRKHLSPYSKILKSRNVAILLLFNESVLFFSAFLSWYIHILIYELGGVELIALIFTLTLSYGPSLIMLFLI